MILSELVQQTISRFVQVSIANPRLDAELLIAHFTGLNRLEINLHSKDQISEHTLLQTENAVSRRMNHEPIQYILGETEFYGIPLKVNASVLIPRPETELLVERIVTENYLVKSILEIGTGSGCLAIALQKLLPNSCVTATDISSPALQIARHNAIANKAKIAFLQSDLWENIAGKFDLIVSNPPYIPQNEYDELPNEIKRFEPQSALLAQEEGIYFYRRILEKAAEYLTENGIIYFEIGYNLAEKIKNTARQNGFEKVEVYRDLNGFERMMRIEKTCHHNCQV